MFSYTWKKYLTVIALLMKRSVNGEQTLSMNHTDFERASGGKKVKYSFSNLQLNNGRINSAVKHTPIARDLATMLQEEPATNQLLRNQLFEFSMTGSFQLTIKNLTPVVTEETKVEEVAETEAVAENTEA